MSAPDAPAGRVPALDGVRGMAILLVLLFHLFTPAPSSAVSTFFAALLGSGFVGVDLFFVLSGFLITGILLRTREQPHYFRNFYAKRVLRIFPAYYLVALFVLYVYPWFNAPLAHSGLRGEAGWLLLFAQNWKGALLGEGGAWPGVDHFWSLAIEEQFYLAWPLLVWYTPPARIGQVCAAIAALSIGLKLALLAAGASWLKIYMATPAHLEGLALGGLVAVWQAQRRFARTPRWLQVAGIVSSLALLALAFSKAGYKLTSPRQVALHTTFAAVAFAWVLWRLVGPDASTRLRSAMRARLLVFLGKYSFGIYLIHYVVYWQIKHAVFEALPHWDRNWQILLNGTLVTAVTIALAMLMYHLVEEPILRLRHHFEVAGRSDSSRIAATVPPPP